MTCKEANEMSIIDFLFNHGIEPKKVVGNNYWYLSPIHDEKTPSFKVDARINRWYDHAMGIGGKLVDLAVRLNQVSVADLLKKIEGKDFQNSFSFHKPEIKTPSTIIKKVKEVENKALLSYLKHRAIDKIDVAKSYCEEVYFSINSKNYFGIGLKNNNGGYEIRNKYFKGCIGPKGITTFLGKTSKAVLFEGLFDFLSAYQKFETLKDFSFIILNSVNQIPVAIEYLHKINPDLVVAYFDNDEAGNKCFQTLKAFFPNALDHSHLYTEYKDLNEMIMKTKNKQND